MDNIKRIKINDEWYVSIKDAIKVMKDTKDIETSIKAILPKEVYKTEMQVDKENKEELSDFNKKLKKGLDWNPRKEG